MNINLKCFTSSSMLLLGLLLFASSCKQYDNPPPVFEELKDLTKSQRKVLVVSIDGLSAEQLEAIAPPTIKGLLNHSKYSYKTLNTETDASGWVSMLTGARYTKHKIGNNNFEVEREGNDEDHGEIASFRNVMDYVTEYKNVKTAFVTTWDNLRHYSRMADYTPIVSTDKGVRDSTLSLLTNVNSLGVVFANFRDAAISGAKNGYTISNEGFKNAVLQTDGYISEFLNAIKARKNYEKEEWLVVVTSNHAGNGSQSESLFTIYNFERLIGQELEAETIVAPRFFGFDNAGLNAFRARNPVELSEEANYNIAKTGQITVEAKIKVNKNASGNYSYSWPPFLSKVSARSGNTAGWSFFRSGNAVSFFVADGSVKIEVGTGASIGVNEVWSHFTGVFSTVNGKPTSKVYVNGSLAATGESTTLNVSKVLSSSPLTFGFQPEVFSSAYLDFYMADVKIWNTVLSDDEIKENANRVGIAENHPKIQNLVGYWPLNKIEDGAFKNQVVGKPNLPVLGKTDFNTFANNLPYVKPEKAVLNRGEDITTQILYWFNIAVNPDWKLDGNNVLKNFEIEFLKD